MKANIKAIAGSILMLAASAGSAQGKLEKVTLLNGKIEIRIPPVLTAMPDELWAFKYHKSQRPLLVLSDKYAEVNLIGNSTGIPSSEKKITAFKDEQIAALQKRYPNLRVLESGTKVVDGKNIPFCKFMTEAVDQKVFNYYFFTVLDGKVLMFTFNCIEKYKKDWESTADQIMLSLRTK